MHCLRGDIYSSKDMETGMLSANSEADMKIDCSDDLLEQASAE